MATARVGFAAGAEDAITPVVIGDLLLGFMDFDGLFGLVAVPREEKSNR